MSAAPSFQWLYGSQMDHHARCACGAFVSLRPRLVYKSLTQADDECDDCFRVREIALTKELRS